MKLSELVPNPENPRTITAEQQEALKKSLYEFGDLSGFVFNEVSGYLVGAHQRQKVLPPDAEIIIEKKYSKPTRTGTVAEGYVIVDNERFSYRQVRWGKKREMAANIAANKHGGQFNDAKLAPWLLDLDAVNFDFDLIGFSQEEFENICAPFRTMPDGSELVGNPTLADRFLIVPFSVLDARQGYWQDRKRQWIALGIRSEVGRGEGNMTGSTRQKEYTIGAVPPNQKAILKRTGKYE